MNDQFQMNLTTFFVNLSFFKSGTTAGLAFHGLSFQEMQIIPFKMHRSCGYI
jgi:hypothetical protein